MKTSLTGTPNETVTLPAALLFDLILEADTYNPSVATVARWFLAKSSPAWFCRLELLDRCGTNAGADA